MKNPYIIVLGKVLLFVVVFILLDNIIGIGFNRLRQFAFEKNYLSVQFKTEYCIEKATNDVFIIGSSTGSHHYNTRQIEDSTGLSVYNFAQDGCFFLFQNTLINLLLDRYSPKTIIWEIGESCLSNDLDKPSEYQSINDIYPWYNHPYVKRIVNDKDNFQRFRMLIKSYIYNSKLIDYLYLSFVNRNDNSQKGYIPIEPSSFAKTDKGMDYYNNLNIVPENVELLNNTLKRCNEKGVQVIITSSPRYYGNFIKQTCYYQALMELLKQNDIDYLDFFNVEPFCNDSTLFKDNDHMNKIGTNIYMEMFIPKLKKVLITE